MCNERLLFCSPQAHTANSTLIIDQTNTKTHTLYCLFLENCNIYILLLLFHDYYFISVIINYSQVGAEVPTL